VTKVKTTVGGIPLLPGATFLSEAEAAASMQQSLADDLRAFHGDAAADEYLAALANTPAITCVKPRPGVLVTPMTTQVAGIEPPVTTKPYIRVLKPRDSLNYIAIDWKLSFDGEPEDEWDTWPLGSD
jgi:hypothetical protein